jgi:alanyl-tRNA synthetase
MRIIAEVLHNTSADLLLPLATEISKAGATIALLAHEDTGQIAFAQHPSAAKDMSALLKQIFEKYPGKGGGTRDFVRAKLTSPKDSHPAITQATTLL